MKRLLKAANEAIAELDFKIDKADKILDQLKEDTVARTSMHRLLTDEKETLETEIESLKEHLKRTNSDKKEENAG